MTDEPLKHIARINPPWTTVALTVCGRNTADVGDVATFDEANEFIKAHGKKRTYFEFCVTCCENARSHKWELDPISITHEFLSAYKWARTARQLGGEQIERELHALGRLAAYHAEEYAALVAPPDETDTISLNAHRKK